MCAGVCAYNMNARQISKHASSALSAETKHQLSNTQMQLTYNTQLSNTHLNSQAHINSQSTDAVNSQTHINSETQNHNLTNIQCQETIPTHSKFVNINDMTCLQVFGQPMRTHTVQLTQNKITVACRAPHWSCMWRDNVVII